MFITQVNLFLSALLHNSLSTECHSLSSVTSYIKLNIELNFIVFEKKNLHRQLLLNLHLPKDMMDITKPLCNDWRQHIDNPAGMQ